MCSCQLTTHTRLKQSCFSITSWLQFPIRIYEMPIHGLAESITGVTMSRNTGRTVHTGPKYRSWVLVKCVWGGAYYWFWLRKGTGYSFHAFLTCIIVTFAAYSLFSVRYRYIRGRCGRCGLCSVSWHPWGYDVTKHHTGRTGPKYRSWVLVKCVWCGAYYWLWLRQESPAIAEKTSRRESLSKIAPIRRANNAVADNIGLSSFV